MLHSLCSKDFLFLSYDIDLFGYACMLIKTMLNMCSNHMHLFSIITDIVLVFDKRKDLSSDVF